MSSVRYMGTIMLLAASAAALSACGGKSEVKTGSLTQRFAMVDSEGRQFGVVELDPVNGGSVSDSQGRLIGRIVAPQPAAVASAAPVTAPAVTVQ